MDKSNNTGLCNTTVNFGDPKFLQPRHNKGRRLMAVKSQLRVLMQMTAPNFHIFSKFSDAVDDWHGLAPYSYKKPEIKEQRNGQ